MEKLLQHYLRILDIDPFGYFIRLINLSHNQSLDLSHIHVRQCSSSDSILTLNSYTFNDQVQPLLHSGAVVTLYSNQSSQYKFDIEPHIFTAQNISRWLTNDDSRTEILIKKLVIDHHRTCSSATNDVPLLFINRPVYPKQLSTKVISNSNQYTKFVYPYCLPINDSVNPHTSAINDQKEVKLRMNICHKNNQPVKHFDSYPRRLTTAPKIIQLPK